MDNGMDKLWVIDRDGGEWRIISLDGHVVAGNIPFGEVAEHIAYLHNENFMKEKATEDLILENTNAYAFQLACTVCWDDRPAINKRKDTPGKVWICPSCESIHFLKYATGYIKDGKAKLTWVKREREEDAS